MDIKLQTAFFSSPMSLLWDWV